MQYGGFIFATFVAIVGMIISIIIIIQERQATQKKLRPHAH